MDTDVRGGKEGGGSFCGGCYALGQPGSRIFEHGACELWIEIVGKWGVGCNIASSCLVRLESLLSLLDCFGEKQMGVLGVYGPGPSQSIGVGIGIVSKASEQASN